MKKRNLLKRIAAVAMSAAMLLGMSGAVSAAEVNRQVINPAAKGSLTIKKLQTGTETPIEGVTFKYVKVGDFELSGTNNFNGFTITNSDLEGYLKAAGLTSIPGFADPTVYDGEAIQKALETAVATPDTEEAIKALAVNTLGTTSETGEASVNNLDLGIYLVAETEAPAEVTKMSSPFIVSVPILDTNDQDGTQTWNYNVVAQPKNDYINERPEPTKTVIDENGEPVVDPSAAIGSTVNFEIKSKVPSVAGTLEKFIFTDTLSKGLDFAGTADKCITAIETSTDGIQWTDIAENAVTSKAIEGKTLTVTFDPAKIQQNGYKFVRVQYQAELNEKAIVAINSGSNVNTFTVDYTNNPGIEKPTAEATVDTYGFTLQKNNEKNTALAGAVFELYDAGTGGNKVSFYTAVDENGNVIGNAVTEVTTGDDGQANFYGLKAGTYYLEEIKAPEGYNILKDRVKIVVSEDTTVFVEEEEAADITIVNTKGFTLPTTGGMGTTIFTIGGVILMAGAAVLIIRMNRKEREN